MSAWPTLGIPTLPVLSTVSLYGVGPANGGILTLPTSTAWNSANKAQYMPFRIFAPTIITKLWWFNGATASGNVDCGIYDAALMRLVSTGSTAQAGTSVLQIVDITDVLLGPGLYYFALALDNTTGTIMRAGTSGTAIMVGFGIFSQNSAFPLPATATLANSPNITPIMGALVGRTVL